MKVDCGYTQDQGTVVRDCSNAGTGSGFAVTGSGAGVFGLTKPDAQIAVKPFQIFRKELALKASYINPCTQQRALQLIDSGRLDVQSMVCAAIGLEQLEDVLRDPSMRAKGKYIVMPEK